MFLVNFASMNAWMLPTYSVINTSYASLLKQNITSKTYLISANAQIDGDKRMNLMFRAGNRILHSYKNVCRLTDL